MRQLLPWQQWRSCCHGDTHSSPIMQDQGLAWCQVSQWKCHSFCAFIREACSQAQVYAWLCMHVICVCMLCAACQLCSGQVLLWERTLSHGLVCVCPCAQCVCSTVSLFMCLWTQLERERQLETVRERQAQPCGQFSLAGNLIERWPEPWAKLDVH